MICYRQRLQHSSLNSFKRFFITRIMIHTEKSIAAKTAICERERVSMGRKSERETETDWRLLFGALLALSKHRS